MNLPLRWEYGTRETALSAVKNIGSSARRLRFYSKHHVCSQLSVTSVPADPTHSSGLCGNQAHMCHTEMHPGNTPMHI